MRNVIKVGSLMVAAAVLTTMSLVVAANAGPTSTWQLVPAPRSASTMVPVHHYWKSGCHYHPGERYCVRYDSYGNCTKWGHRHYCHQHGGSSGGGGSGY